MSNLLLQYAHDTEGNMVYVGNAQKGQKYTCPNCNAELLLKISKIPEGQKYHRRNHFAHKGNSDNHCSESFLHKLFKEKCKEFIHKKITDKESIDFEWKCGKCGEKHKGNLLKKAVKVLTEYKLGECIPDIALFDEKGNVIIVIEIVVTHKPEPYALKYYYDNKIACLQLKIEDFDDCDKIPEKLAHPVNVNLCPNPVCKKCGNIIHTAKLVTVVADCYNCGKQITISMMLGDNHLESPAKFNENEIQIAKRLGANIKECYSRTKNEKYHANVCTNCNAFIGDFFIHEYLDSPHEKEYDIGHKCFECLDEG